RRVGAERASLHGRARVAFLARVRRATAAARGRRARPAALDVHHAPVAAGGLERLDGRPRPIGRRAGRPADPRLRPDELAARDAAPRVRSSAAPGSRARGRRVRRGGGDRGGIDGDAEGVSVLEQRPRAGGARRGRVRVQRGACRGRRQHRCERLRPRAAALPARARRAGAGGGRARRPMGARDRVLRRVRRAGTSARAGNRFPGAGRPRRLDCRRALARERTARRRFVTDVVCLGILVADVIARPVDRVPDSGSLALVGEIVLRGGGCALNTGTALTRLGLSVACAGKVGGDAFGDFVIGLLDERGVDRSLVARDASLPTSATVVLVDEAGERTFLHVPGANGTVGADELDLDRVLAARALHVAGALVMPALDGEPMAALLAEAQRRGVTTSLDTVWDATGEWSRLEPSLPHLDLLCLSH